MAEKCFHLIGPDDDEDESQSESGSNSHQMMKEHQEVRSSVRLS